MSFEHATGNASSRIRVLFLCWGFSIHAKRRIQIFVDDPGFDVAVVSTYDYGFKGARDLRLGASEVSPEGVRLATVKYRLSHWLSPGARERIKKALTLVGIISELPKAYRDLKTLRASVREFRPNIVFLQTLQYPSFLAYVLPRDLPIVVTFWNGDVTHYAKWTGIEMLLKKQLVRYGIKRANAITVNCRTALEKCMEHGATPEKVHLIPYPGVDLTRFRPGFRDDARRRLGIDKSKVVLCPRGLGQFFNSDIIIEAAALVARQVSDVLFLFISGVGGQPEWNRHMWRAQELGIANNLRWDGQVPWEDMPSYYQAADVMISILANDSMPNCMIEAMACGVPVIMSDTPQHREWVADSSNGFLCEPRDASECATRMLQVLQDSGDLARRFSAINLDRVAREANSAVNSERIKQLVRDLVEGRGAEVPA